jgi:hypothetical protein
MMKEEGMANEKIPTPEQVKAEFSEWLDEIDPDALPVVVRALKWGRLMRLAMENAQNRESDAN